MSLQTKILLFGLAVGLVCFGLNLFLLASQDQISPELSFLGPFFIVVALCGFVFSYFPLAKSSQRKASLRVWVMLVAAVIAGAANVYALFFTDFYQQLLGLGSRPGEDHGPGLELTPILPSR